MSEILGIRTLKKILKTNVKNSGNKIVYIGDGSLGKHINRIDEFDIMPDGSNVGIAILDYGRLQDTLNFLESIPKDFMGKVFILSQGNPPNHEETIQKFIKGMKNTYIYTNSINLGVGKARNALFNMINCEWILSLDNDFKFLSNPFEELAKIQSLSGAHFINVGFFDSSSSQSSFGGHIEVKVNSNNQPRMIIRGASESERQNLDIFYFNDLIFGGASMLNRNTFLSLGGFDSAFQVGFEDVDFSIRVFRAGYKVASINQIFFNHGSVESTNQDYRNVRFNREHISASAALLAKKYKFVTWEKEDDKWLENKLG